MGPRCRFRMVLHTEDGLISMPHSLDSVVVQVHVRDLDFAVAKRIGIDAEAVILRRDFHFSGLPIEHGMIRAMMSKLEFVGLAAERESKNLVTQADAEYWNFTD